MTEEKTAIRVTMTISGTTDLEKKIISEYNAHPNKQNNLIASLGNTLALAFNWSSLENPKIDHFKMEKLPANQTNTEEVEQK